MQHISCQISLNYTYGVINVCVAKFTAFFMQDIGVCNEFFLLSATSQEIKAAKPTNLQAVAVMLYRHGRRVDANFFIRWDRESVFFYAATNVESQLPNLPTRKVTLKNHETRGHFKRGAQMISSP